MIRYSLRAAADSDLDFITEMLLGAINWAPDRDYPLEQLITDPANLHYVADWMRPTDFGVIAVDDDGASVGACWLRYFTSDDPSYGYVADDVPELSIGVVPDWRGRGVGRALIRATFDAARERGIRRIGLSVEHGNGAAKLYYAEGFTYYGTDDGADTLVADVSPRVDPGVRHTTHRRNDN